MSAFSSGMISAPVVPSRRSVTGATSGFDVVLAVTSPNLAHPEGFDRAVSGMGGQSRTGQHEMARQVAHAIDTGDHLLVQAGTGTGKSLAYLIPLIAHSLVSDKPTLVSTAVLEM